MHLKPWSLIAALLVAGAVAACGESLDAGPACPVLCPGPIVQLQETVIEAVALDTTIGGLPPIGTEPYILLANRPGIVATYGIVRFDTLFARYNPPGDDDTTTVPVTALDSAYLRLRFDTASTIATAPVTFELFDVSGVAGDTITAEFAAAVAGSSPFADTTVAVAALGDSLRIEIPKEFLQAKVTQADTDPSTRLRVAIRVSSAEPVQLRALASNAGGPPLLIYDPVPADTAIRPFTITTYSETPAEPPGLAARLRDFVVYTVRTPPAGATELSVGGLPANRALFRFDIPTELIDSTTIVRATLILYQSGEGVGSDSLAIIPQIGVAGPAVTDPRSQVLLAADALVYGVDTVTVLPGSADSVTVDIVGLISRWRLTPADTLPRVLVLRAAGEGSLPEQVTFYSEEAGDPLRRPRLRIRYIPAVDFGLP